MVAGLEEISEGEVRIGERVVNRVPSRDRDVAMVFQSYALYPHMSVRDNIGYPLDLRKIPRAERDRSIGEVAELLEIGHLLQRKPRALSGGQRQRVALARAIVRDPACFLMDEPLSNLDAKLRVSMRGEIKRLQKRLQATTVYVTHDQAEATTMADLVAVMHEGALQQLAPPIEVYDLPANRFVATFVGSPAMNVLSVALDGERRSAVVGAQHVSLPNGIYDAAAAGAATELGVRPEDLALAEPGKGQLSGEVYVVEPLGNETLVEVRVAEAVLSVRAPRGWDAPIGASVGVTLRPAAATFFGADGATVVGRSDRELPRRLPAFAVGASTVT
jgi:multiple sugar transport system ATP-binding protein